MGEPLVQLSDGRVMTLSQFQAMVNQAMSSYSQQMTLAIEQLSGLQDELYGVSATLAGGWAVGRYKAQTLTLTERSGHWIHVASPSWPSPATSILEGVTAFGDVAWAVGQYNVDVTTSKGLISVSYSLILRWASGRWTQVPSPNR